MALLLAAVAILSSLPAWAASGMEEIVVTATRSEKLIRANPWSVSVLNRKQLQAQGVDQLADVLKDLPGVFVSDAGQAGQKRIRMRGEDSRRMALLIDGEEFSDHREVGVPLLVDTVNLQRIEVVRGPASVLYGPRAMGGVINVITRMEHEAPLEGELSASFNGATSGTLYAVNLGGAHQNTDWQFSLSNNVQHERRTPDGQVDNTAYQSDGVSASVHQVMGDQRIGLAFEKFSSSSGVYVDPAVRFTPPFLDFSIDIPVRDRDKVRFDYRFERSVGHFDGLKVDAYRQTSDREFNTETVMQIAPVMVLDSNIKTLSQLVSKGINIQSDWHFGDAHAVIAGYQYLNDEVDQTRHRSTLVNDNPATSEIVTDVAQLSTHAVYVQDDWALTPYLSLLAGVRLYEVQGSLEKSSRLAELPQFSDDHAVASIALVHDLTPHVTVRVNLSQGYIYPSLLNLAMGAFAGPRFINPVADLSPETSITREAGLRFAGEKLTVDATLFYTTAQNYIDHVRCDVTDDCLTSADEIYKNVGRASTTGLELSTHLTAGRYEPYASITWLRRHKQYESVDTWDAGIPNLSGRVGLVTSFGAVGEVDVYSRLESSADEEEMTSHGVSIEHHAGFITLNLQVRWRWAQRYRLGLELENITDTRYSFATENLLAPGRNLRATFGINL